MSKSQPGDQQPQAQGSNPAIPQQILQQADAAASSAAAESPQRPTAESFPPIEDVPPPPYSAGQYGEVELRQNGFDTGARVASDGRVEIKIDRINRRLTNILPRQFTPDDAKPFIPDSLGAIGGLPPPPLNIVIQVVGSRGDVQPFIALGQVLKNKFNHRVRLATHPVFRDFVIENGLEFFSIGGDPAELMAFMVKNPGLIPGVEALKSGEIGKKRKGIYEMITGCWRSCIEPGDGTGEPVSDALLDGRSSVESGISMGDPTEKPFIADAIIANPPSFAHIHIAEKLGIPLHLMFTMPWSPTQAYPHPLANILSSSTDQGIANFISYILVDLLTWQGIGDVINRFREKTLKLEPISILWAAGSLHRLRIPWTYAWSPALIPKPADWSNFIDIAGFFFLDLATNYQPPEDLARFLDAGPPPVYIGFGSIVVDDPNAMTKLIFEAVKLTGQRALVSKGWGGFSAGELGQPDDVFMLGNCPHDWLFKRVSAVVHHGGAGTTAAGVKAGKPTVIVPFFGDQPFWGNMVNRAGAGPKPIPHAELTARNLADAILEALTPASLAKAQDLSLKIQNENGPTDGADSFHKFLEISKLRCSLAPGRTAVWRIRRTDIRLSALAATVLANEHLIEFSDLKLYRPCEYEVDTGPPEPISGGAAAIIGSIGSVTAGVADFPSEVLRGVRGASDEAKRKKSPPHDQLSPGSSPHRQSSMSLVFPNRSRRSSDNLPPPSPGMITPSSTSETGDDVVEPRSPTETEARRERPFRRSSSEFSHVRSVSRDANRVTLGTAIGSAKATANIVAIGIKSPMDFTMSLAKGFHNLPRLYNDKTIRPVEKVTDFNSGLKVAGKNFAYGFMDGIGGLVTQPMQGYKEEGGAGLVKGLVKGSFGLVVKPGAAIWGLPAYTMKGIYTEIAKHSGKSTTNYIIAARVAQGYDDYQASSEGDRERILAAWNSPELKRRHQQKKTGLRSPLASQVDVSTSDLSKIPGASQPDVATHGSSKDRLTDENGQLLKGFFQTRHLTYDERKELARRKKEQQASITGKQPDLKQTTDDEFRDAIRAAVKKTSTNDPKEDQAIENAIWASVRELQRPTPNTKADVHMDDDEAFRRALAASVAEYKRAQEIGRDGGIVMEKKGRQDDDEDDELTRAITASLEEYYHEGEPTYTQEDEDFKHAMAESLKTSETAKPSIQPPLPPRSTTQVDDSDDAELQEAIRLSKQEHSQKTSDLEKQQTEEDIVLEYVKKQSLAEEEFQRQHMKSK